MKNCQKVKVKRRSRTKTANISRKHHSVVAIRLSVRKSRLPERMAWSDF